MNKQKAIIIDIDGTLTTDPLMIPEDLKYTREGKDKFYSKVKWYSPHKMKTNKNVAILIKALQKNGIFPIFVTAREDVKEVTNNTLTYLQGLFGDNIALYMREFDDFRSNYVVKEELYKEYIKDVYDILFVLEDEENNIEMFKKNKLTVLQVKQ